MCSESNCPNQTAAGEWGQVWVGVKRCPLLLCVCVCGWEWASGYVSARGLQLFSTEEKGAWRGWSIRLLLPFGHLCSRDSTQGLVLAKSVLTFYTMIACVLLLTSIKCLSTKKISLRLLEMYVIWFQKFYASSLAKHREVPHDLNKFSSFLRMQFKFKKMFIWHDGWNLLHNNPVSRGETRLVMSW